MDWLLGVAGVLLVLGVMADATVTTLMPGCGAGPVTRVLTGGARPLVLRLDRSPLARVTPHVGGLVLLTTVLVWVGTLWLGFALLFAADPGSVVASQTGVPADWWEVVYFSGFTAFTLGTGDFVPSGDGWRVVTAGASFLGLFLVTLAITYLVSVISAVVSRRSFAGSVHLLGDDGVDVVVRAWDDGRLSSSALSSLTSLATQAVQVSEQHYAYPALHVFASRDRRTSAQAGVATLAELVLVLDDGLDPSVRPSTSVRGLLRRAVALYRQAAPDGVSSSEDPVHAPPSLQPLRDAGIPVVDDDTFRRCIAEDPRHDVMAIPAE